MSKEKKYRFYYSRKQDAIDEDMWGFAPRYTFVKTPDGYKQYSELCSIKGSKCNWSDAELVYETDDNPEIITHEAIPELIANLEAKLAESEKNLALCEQLREVEENEYSKDIGKTNSALLRKCEQTSRLIEEIKRLKQQLAEKDQAIEGLQELNQSLGQTCNNDAKEIERLREQLVEKDVEFQSLKLLLDAVDHYKQYQKDANLVILNPENCYADGYKVVIKTDNQTAIAELEKVKERFNDRLDNFYLPLDHRQTLKEVFKQIDQQIKELRGDKND